jgi:hypothetical protein
LAAALFASDHETAKERQTDRGGARAVHSVPEFLIMPTPRCCLRLGNSAVDVCGAVAAWARPARGALPAEFFCDRHRGPTDQPITQGFLARRVTLRVEVLIAGTSLRPAEAHLEAVERLMRVVEAAGGLMNLHDVSSVVGRYTPPAPPRAKTPPRGGS